MTTAHQYLPLSSNAELCHPHTAIPATDSPGQGEFGLLTIAVSDWAPKTYRSTPPSICDGMSAAVSRAFAVAYNSSEHAAQRKRWCLVLHTGSTLILTNLDQRPSDPSVFPSFIRRYHTQAEAEAVMQLENAERHRLARVPREWCVVVCPLAETGKAGETR